VDGDADRHLVGPGVLVLDQVADQQRVHLPLLPRGGFGRRLAGDDFERLRDVYVVDDVGGLDAVARAAGNGLAEGGLHGGPAAGRLAEDHFAVVDAHLDVVAALRRMGYALAV